MIGNKHGYIDKTGTIRIQPQFDEARNFSEELAAVKIGSKWGFIDKTGKTVIKAQYGEAHNFSEGLAPVKIAAKYVFFEKNGTRTLIGADKSIGKWGYVNKSGELIITPQFDWAMNFTGDVAAVITDFKTGYIDKTGKYIWKPSN